MDKDNLPQDLRYCSRSDHTHNITLNHLSIHPIESEDTPFDEFRGMEATMRLIDIGVVPGKPFPDDTSARFNHLDEAVQATTDDKLYPSKDIPPPVTPTGMQATDGEVIVQDGYESGQDKKYNQPFDHERVPNQEMDCIPPYEQQATELDILEALRMVKVEEPSVLDVNNDISGGSSFAEDENFEAEETLPSDMMDEECEDTASMQSTDGNRMLCHPSGELERSDYRQESGVEESPRLEDFIQEKAEDEPELKPSYQVKDEQESRVQLVGIGTFGKVYKVEDDNGVRCIKTLEVYPDDQQRRQALEAEMSIPPTLDHTNIVEHYYGYENSAEKDKFQTFVIEMEVMEGGSLASYMGREQLSEEEITIFAKQLLEGVRYMHQQNVIHRDIKPDNLLLDGSFERLKIADFGTAVRLDTNNGTVAESSAIGTPRYIAPEVWRCEPHGKPADIWSVGATMVEMVNGQPPFDEQNIDSRNAYALMFKVGMHGARPLVQRHITSQLDDVINGCLHSDPCDRLTADELLQQSVFY